ncbi:hypothetical protein JHK87_031592 [Glycine soja]|nr:hypothetical protein JHK87_031592 [Glycine soja]
MALLHSLFALLFLLLSLQLHTVSCALLLSLRHHHNTLHQQRPMIHANQTNCALFVGTWVQDDSYPIYQSSNCPIIDPQFNCKMFGRPDSDYLRYRWRPLNCDLPRYPQKLKAKTFLTKITFLLFTKALQVSSENGVQWGGVSTANEGQNCDVFTRAQPMAITDLHDICCSSSDTNTIGQRGTTLNLQILGKRKVSTVILQQQNSMCCVPFCYRLHSKSDIFNRTKYLFAKGGDYGVTISFYRAPYLVEIDVVQGKRILRLEEVDGNGDVWRSVDVLSFNTGHWWDYMELGGKYYQDMDRLAALERGMKTWANWVDSNVDRSRTKVFFLGISPSHTNPNEWNSGVTAGLTTKNCYGETTPITSTGTAYPGVYPEQMRVVDMVIRGMSNPAYLLDITMLSAFRKDAHPSIYSGDLNPQQRANPTYSADCSHWCLPGLPDTWNELFYTTLFY